MTKGEQTRARIVGSAIKAFGKTGYFDASLDQISKSAKVQRPAIVNYFGSKLGLYQACIQAVLSEFAEEAGKRQGPGDSAVDRLDLNFAMNLELATRKPEHGKLIVLFYYGASSNAELRGVWQATSADIRARYRGLIEAGIREGSVRVQEPALVAALLHESIMGMMINFISSDVKATLPSMRAKWRFLKSSLLGIRA